jgi:AraC-like DNA-binding protein
MHFRYYAPSPEFEAFVHRYAHFYTDRDEVGGEMRFLPAGRPIVTLSRGDPFTVFNALYPEGLAQSGNLVVGQQQRYYTIVPGPRFVHFTIMFKPTALYRLFGRAMDVMLNSGAPLERFLPSLQSELSVAGNTGDLSDVAAVIAMIERLLHARLRTAASPEGLIDTAVDGIVSAGGMVTVSSLARRAQLSTRGFRRAFAREVGISPKGFIRIVRLQNVFAILREKHSRAETWCQTALSYGYYDQTHFIKDFKDFCGLPPSAYVRRIAHHSRHLERFFLAPLA